MIKNPVSPKTANPATPSPITVPPPKDILSACGKLVLAACVVLTLVLVAIFIPIFPANAEKIAPKINATTISMCVVGTMKEIAASAILAPTTKKVSNLYSAFRKAKAPSYMWLDIAAILPSPASCFKTQALFTHINNKPNTARIAGT